MSMLAAWNHVFRETMRGLRPPAFEYKVAINYPVGYWDCCRCDYTVRPQDMAAHAYQVHGFSTPENIRIECGV